MQINKLVISKRACKYKKFPKIALKKRAKKLNLVEFVKLNSSLLCKREVTLKIKRNIATTDERYKKSIIHTLKLAKNSSQTPSPK